jgi:hypothetical protein
VQQGGASLGHNAKGNPPRITSTQRVCSARGDCKVP